MEDPHSGGPFKCFECLPSDPVDLVLLSVNNKMYKTFMYISDSQYK